MTDFAELSLGVNTSGLKKGEQAQDRFAASSEKMERRTTVASRAAGKALGAIGVALGAALAGGQLVRQISEFETSISRVAAVSRASASDLKAMRDIAKDLGSTTEFTASQAADGLGFLAMAGFNASESIAAIPAVLDLATASGMGLASAADIASNVMSGFGIEAGNAANVTDVLAAASSRANTDVGQLGQAMSTVAPIAKALGIGVEDTAAAIGIMSDAGIQGERAGTALRGVLASLAGPTSQAQEVLSKYGLTVADVNPEMRSMADIMGDLGERGLSTADAMTIFGREAASGALVMVEGASRLREFGSELRNVEGAAGDMAATMRDNLGGDIKGLQSAVSGLILQIGDAGLTAAIRGAVGVIKNIVLVISQLVELVTWGFDKIENFKNAMFNLGTTSNQTYRAIDNISLALADEDRAIRAVSASLPIGTKLSRDAALAKLGEARAIYQKIEAAREEARDVVRLTAEYRGLQGQVEELAAFGSQLGGANSALDGGPFAPSLSRAGFENNLNLLRQSLTAQRELMSGAMINTETYDTASETIKRLEAAISATSGEIVTMGGSITDVGDRAVVDFDNVSTAISNAGGSVPALTTNIETATDAVATMADAVKGRLSDAWSDFVDGGFKDFKGFAKSILDTFKDMLMQMIATAAKNKIMVSLGMGGTGGGVGGIAQAGMSMLGGGGGAGGLGGIGSAIGGAGGLAGLGTAALGGAQFVGAGFMSGGLAGGASAIGTALSGATMGIGGAAAALGAVAAPLLAVYAAVKFFQKSTVTLNKGIRVAVDGIEASAETFKRTETSQFFGLSKSRQTSFKDDPNNPVIGAVGEIQTAVTSAAATLGYGASIFDQFSYDFKLSLKGLSDEQKSAAITEELSKMGDQFAMLVPGMAGFNELLEAANAAVARAGTLGSTRFESQMLMAAARRGEITTAGAGAGGTRGEDLIRLRSMDETNKTTADNTAKQTALMERLLRIWERFEIDGVPQGPVVA